MTLSYLLRGCRFAGQGADTYRASNHQVGYKRTTVASTGGCLWAINVRTPSEIALKIEISALVRLLFLVFP
jgi:hypothetical protein